MPQTASGAFILRNPCRTARSLTHQQKSDRGAGRDQQRACAYGRAGQFIASGLQAPACKKPGRSGKDCQCNESRTGREFYPIA